MNYINSYKRKLVNSVNQISKHKLIFDFDTTEFYEFKILDKYGKQIKISDQSRFYLCGSTTADNKNIIFFSEDFEIKDDVLTFKINSNTKEYLEKITDRNVHIYIEIGEIKNGVSTVLLMDEAEANNRLYTTGTPQPLELEKYYTKSEIDSLFSSFDLEFVESDPIYSADKPNIALKSELFSKSYNDLTDKPTNLQEIGISITTDDIISNYGSGEDLTTELANIENNMWQNVEQQFNNRNYVKSISGLSADENGDVPGIVTTVNNIPADDQWGNLWLFSTDIQHNSPEQSVGQVLDELTAKIGDIESVLDAINGEVI